MFPLVPKLRLGMPLRAKLCFDGSTLVADGRAHRGNGIARTHALPNGVWGAKGKPARKRYFVSAGFYLNKTRAWLASRS